MCAKNKCCKPSELFLLQTLAPFFPGYPERNIVIGWCKYHCPNPQNHSKLRVVGQASIVENVFTHDELTTYLILNE